MPTAKKSEWYVCNEDLSGSIDGVVVTIHKGELVRANSKVYKAYKMHFSEAAERDFTRFDVEQATAAPGERRGE